MVAKTLARQMPTKLKTCQWSNFGDVPLKNKSSFNFCQYIIFKPYTSISQKILKREHLVLTLSEALFVGGFQSPNLRQALLHPNFPPFLKPLFPLTCFLFHPFLRYFRQLHHLHVKLFITDFAINHKIPQKSDIKENFLASYEKAQITWNVSVIWHRKCSFKK